MPTPTEDLSPEERRVEQEVEADLAADPDDDDETAREAVELGLMEAGASEEGAEIGEHLD